MDVVFPILIIVVLFVLLIILMRLIPSKGAIGEKRVARILEKLPEGKYSVINNLLLNNSGYTSQVDHVVVSVYGIFVIETKTYQGIISGGENSEQWTQNIYGNKYEFRNPILQNYGHVKSMKQVLGDYKSVPFISIVAFSSQANLRVSSNIPVVYWSQILDVIRGYENPVIKESDVRRITRLLMASNTDSKETRKDHVKNVRANVKKRQETIASGKCPRCGGDLVLRKGKYGPFYGCSNYPKCTFIQNR
ncbi:MAG: NERD domain-containing protein [Bacteroidales bacterium]|uniref:NERD domain-containing protein n=1 Tax=Candidatus Cryptobacteroides sp. TaxID=2952915 RepID=UPI002A7497AE|nr:NERD domain-containing protein [Candidatus Cryptobacteroides sp.]MDD7234899.1 NERD domain-containing protein [Bacteroidales bacterium]MDY2702223.1 NERD domain-containing protein [Candidatus Cryptobacteroides sp.]MDY5780844.1 NERD domain-containing protein [Candidatus Cryptobacteroides sp.]